MPIAPRVLTALTLTLACLLLGAAHASAATLYVTETGTNTTTCEQGDPCGTLADAFSVAASGDTVDVAAGTFDGAGTGTPVLVRGARAGTPGPAQPDDDAGATVITGALTLTGGPSSVSGVTVRVGSGADAAVTAAGAGFTLADSIVDGGTGVELSASTPTIEDSVVRGSSDAALRVSAGTTGLQATGNVLRGNAGPGVAVGAGIFDGTGSSVSFNRISGNGTASSLNATYAVAGIDLASSPSVALPAPDNFFGCLAGPTDTANCDGVSTGVDASNFMTLTFTGSPVSTAPGTPATLTAALVRSGTATAPTGIAAFPATRVAFSPSPSTGVTLGNAAAVTGTQGTASTTVDSDTEQTVTTTAVLDNAAPAAAVAFVRPAASGGGQSASPAPLPTFAAPDPLKGTPGDDVIRGTPGNDVIDGGNGNDVIDGGGGDDIIIGGNGNDRIDGGSGNDSLRGGAGSDRLFGSVGRDVLTGGTGSDTLLGGVDGDRLFGESGDDSLDGQSGDDGLSGGNGDDSISGGSGRDRASGNDGDDRVRGEGGNDRLSGDNGDDKLSGGSGSDRLNGGRGNDSLTGGSGRDRLVGGPGRDTGRQ